MYPHLGKYVVIRDLPGPPQLKFRPPPEPVTLVRCEQFSNHPEDLPTHCYLKPMYPVTFQSLRFSLCSTAVFSRHTQKFPPRFLHTNSVSYDTTPTTTSTATKIMSEVSAPEPSIGAIPVLGSLQALREWRAAAFDARQTVGFVPTMGALHDGHLSLGKLSNLLSMFSHSNDDYFACLVRRSLQENDLTVISIFVNPAQFAPHEDLATYPRTLPSDLASLSTVVETVVPGEGKAQAVHMPSAVFVPSVKDMYPSGIVQDVAEQKGTFIEVKGFSHQMEGKSRPTFFRGVATVVTKLFNAVQVSSQGAIALNASLLNCNFN